MTCEELDLVGTPELLAALTRRCEAVVVGMAFERGEGKTDHAVYFTGRVVHLCYAMTQLGLVFGDYMRHRTGELK